MLAYFTDRSKGIEAAGQDPARPAFSAGILMRRGEDGADRPLWQRRLENNVAPVRALVAASGRYVVTFDNWHRMGYGDTVVVIYGAGGRLVRKLALAETLPPDEVARLPRTASSIWWGGRHRISADGQTLMLQVNANGALPLVERPEFRPLRIRLESGRIEHGRRGGRRSPPLGSHNHADVLGHGDRLARPARFVNPLFASVHSHGSVSERGANAWTVPSAAARLSPLSVRISMRCAGRTP